MNNECKLEMAAKIGSTLLAKNKLLEEENCRLAATISNMEEKIETLEKSEHKYLSRIESLNEEIVHYESQMRKEKEYQIEMQNIFEEQDKKSQQAIDLNLNEIKRLESTILTLQKNKMENIKDLESSKNATSQTFEETSPSTTSQYLSLNLEFQLLKIRQDQLEQTLKTTSGNTQLQCCKKCENAMPVKSTSKEQCSGLRSKITKRNIFSVSLQVAKSQEANLKLQTLNINKMSSSLTEQTDDDKPKNLLVKPLTHQYEDGSCPILKSSKTKIPSEKIKNTINNQSEIAVQQLIKPPPSAARQLNENETLQDFLMQHINAVKATKLMEYKENDEVPPAVGSDRTAATNPTPALQLNYCSNAQQIQQKHFLARTKQKNVKYKTRHFYNSTLSRTEYDKKKSRQLKIFHQNMDRLSNKTDLITNLLQDLNPDIVILTEHGLNRTNLENTIIKGYRLVADFSRKQHLKGGVAIYCNENLNAEIVNLNASQHGVELICELAAIKLILKEEELYILGVYRPDRNLQDALEAISNFLEAITTWKDPIVIMGDINVDCLKPNTRKNEKQDQELKELLLTYNITRLDLPPTRITRNSRTSIDLVATNLHVNDLSVTIVDNHISDHTGQACSLQTSSSIFTPTITERRNFNNQSLHILRRMLEKESWNEVFNTASAEEAYNAFSSVISYHLDLVCPKKKICKKKKKCSNTLYNQETTRKKEIFKEAFNAYQLSGSDESKAYAALKKKEYDLHIKAMRKEQNSNYINEADNKSKAAWFVINTERRPKKNYRGQHRLSINGTDTTNPFKVAEQLNTYFVNAAEQTLSNTVPRPATVPEALYLNYSLIFWPTNQEEVIKVINTLKPKTSASFDDISSKIIKACVKELAHPVANIINKSFAQGVFPSMLKRAKVYPKFKGGETNKQENYRPISILPTLSKLFEKIALTRLMHHLIYNNLLPEEQHGFIAGRSTSTAIINITEHLIKSLEQGDTATAILLDYSKAFDSLSHEMLLNKLENIGIKGNALTWFKSYLSNRTQAVEITTTIKGRTQKVISNQMAVLRGVPQGSILGPILFIIYVRDLPTYLHGYCRSLMYADDTVLLLQNQTPETLEIKSYIALNMAQQYCNENDLVLNESKSQQIFLGRKRTEVAEIPELTRVRQAKYLGVLIDDQLSWNPHIDQLCQKLSTALYVLRRLKQVSHDNTVKTAYFALFETHLRYGLAAWGSSSKGNLQRVFVLQKKAVRVLSNLGPQDSCRDSFRELKILTVVGHFILEVITHTTSLNLTRGADIHNFPTRRANNYVLPVHRLNIYEKQPSYIGAKYWNILPDEIKAVTNHQRRKSIYNWLLNRPFYSLEEFESGNYEL